MVELLNLSQGFSPSPFFSCCHMSRVFLIRFRLHFLGSSSPVDSHSALNSWHFIYKQLRIGISLTAKSAQIASSACGMPIVFHRRHILCQQFTCITLISVNKWDVRTTLDTPSSTGAASSAPASYVPHVCSMGAWYDSGIFALVRQPSEGEDLLRAGCRCRGRGVERGGDG